MFHHDLSGVRTQLHDLFFEGVANSLSMAFAQQVLDRFTELNYIFQKLDPDSVIRPTPHRVSLGADHDAVRQALERCLAHTSSEMQTWNPIVIDAVFYACTNYHLKHTQATAAHSVGVSASYLCAVLKKSLGMTYIDLLTNVRIYHAKRLLAEDPTQRTIRSPPWPGSTTSGISPRFSAALPAARRSNTRIHSQKGGPQSVKAAYYPSPGQVALHDVPEPGLRHRDEVKPHPLCRRL